MMLQLKFTPEALKAIAKKALKHKAGARGLEVDPRKCNA